MQTERKVLSEFVDQTRINQTLRKKSTLEFSFSDLFPISLVQWCSSNMNLRQFSCTLVNFAKILGLV